MPPRTSQLRQFRCLDALWQIYERRAAALGCTVDRLINEALGHHARTFTPPPSPTPRTTPSPPSPPPKTPSPPPPRPVPPRPPQQPVLFLIFNGQLITVETDPFVIGRRASSSNLVIQDGNVSRRHAAIIRRNGTYYIKDLGSTNGLTFRGTRIDNKRIDEGDLFLICDHELRFTYRGVRG